MINPGMAPDERPRPPIPAAAQPEPETRYRQLVEQMAALVFELTPSGETLFANPAVATATGYPLEELLGKNFWEIFIAPEQRPRLAEFYSLIRSRNVRNFALVLRGRLGEALQFELSTANDYNDQGRLQQIVAIGVQVGGRRIEAQLFANLNALQAAEEELRLQNDALVQAQEASIRERTQYEQLFQFAPGGYLVTDANGLIQQANLTAARLLGAPAEALAGQYLATFLPAQERPAFNLLLREITPDDRRREWETTLINPHGERIPVSMAAAPIAQPAPNAARRRLAGVRWLMRDISARLAAENELREKNVELLELQRRLIDSAEAERLRLAQELHDGPLQDLFGATFALESLSAELAPDKLAEISASLHRATQELRVIAGELRPPALAPFGLEKAIRSFIDQFSRAQPELQFDLQLTPDGQRLPEGTRLALYRIFQQSLNNVAKHAEAQRIQVSLEFEGNTVLLRVRDDGRGFTVPPSWIGLARAGRLGLVGASERAAAIGGSLEIDSAPGRGTEVRVKAPVG